MGKKQGKPSRFNSFASRQHCFPAYPERSLAKPNSSFAEYNSFLAEQNSSSADYNSFPA
jgi:gamma-glutamyl:cysteine ligase YbdK (ATP-grasp superfamily)